MKHFTFFAYNILYVNPGKKLSQKAYFVEKYICYFKRFYCEEKRFYCERKRSTCYEET